MGGLGLGPLIAGLFAQYAPHPTTLVFEVSPGWSWPPPGLCLLVRAGNGEPASSALPCGSRPRHPRSAGRAEFIAAAVRRVRRLRPARAVQLAGARHSSDGVLHQDSHAVQGAVVFAKQYVELCTSTG